MTIKYKTKLASLGQLKVVEFDKNQSNRRFGVILTKINEHRFNELEIALFDDLDSAMIWYEGKVPSQLEGLSNE